MDKNILSMAYLYQSVDTSKGDGCLYKECSDEFPKVIVHKE